MDLGELKQKLIDGDAPGTAELAKQGLDEGMDAQTILNDALIPGMGVVGELFEKNEVDLLVSDVYMPDGTGLDLARRLKSISPELPIVIMTGEPGGGNIQESVDIQVDGFWIKPVEVKNLLKLVSSLLKR